MEVLPVDGGRNEAETGERSPSAPSRFVGRCSVAVGAAPFLPPTSNREAGSRSIPLDHDANDRRRNGGSFRAISLPLLLELDSFSKRGCRISQRNKDGSCFLPL